MFEQGLNIWYVNLALGVIFLGSIVVMWHFRRQIGTGSLRNQLLIAFVGVVALSMLLVVTVFIWQTQRIFTIQIGETYLDLAQTNSQRLVEELAQQTERIQNLTVQSRFYFQADVGKEDADLDTLSSVEREKLLREREEAWINQIEQPWYRNVLGGGSLVNVAFREFLGDFSAFSQLSFVNEYGCLRSTVGTLPDHYCYDDQEWWQKAWNQGEGDVFVGNIVFTPDKQDGTIDIAVPVQFEEDGPIRGVLRARLSLSALGAFTNPPSLGESGSISLINRQGEIVYSSNANQVGEQITDTIKNHLLTEPIDWGGDVDQTGQRIIHSHAALIPSSGQPYLQDLNLVFVVQQTSAEALDTVNQLMSFAIVSGVLVLLLAVVVGSWVAWQVSRPIEALTSVAALIAEGQFERTADVSGPLELRTLAMAFNKLTGQLIGNLTGLERQVADRTRRLGTIAAMAQKLSAILDLDLLLQEVVDQIQSNFGYYYAHIYLIDESRNRLIVAAGTGEAGNLMKAAEHSISLDAPASIVVQAFRTQETIRVDDVRQSQDWLPNPLLPDTHAEMAVPIITEGHVVGILDVQENKVSGLDDGDAKLLGTLANQISVTIRNARLFTAVESSLQEAHTVQKRYLESAWQKTRIENLGSRHHHTHPTAYALNDKTVDQVREIALSRDESSVVEISEGGIETQAVATPIKFRDLNIGSLQLHPAAHNQKWSEDDLHIINAVVSQLSQTADNLRLFDETKDRAAREQVIRSITEKMRSATDLQALARIAAEELGEQLSADYAVLELGIETLEPSTTPSDTPIV